MGASGAVYALSGANFVLGLERVAVLSSRICMTLYHQYQASPSVEVFLQRVLEGRTVHPDSWPSIALMAIHVVASLAQAVDFLNDIELQLTLLRQGAEAYPSQSAAKGTRVGFSAHINGFVGGVVLCLFVQGAQALLRWGWRSKRRIRSGVI
eukprot:c19077_g1_i5.p2 GENE.c19077_g1_i5~~c19077_g1_i5.p2  ORF type:complete len:152 (-),score=31.88 c19077_g1_i5:177-632(-)